MSAASATSAPHPGADPRRRRLAWAAAWIGLLAIFGTFFLISPAEAPPRPGVRAWSEFSLLYWLTEAMALGHIVRTPQGVEIKTLVLHIAAALVLVLAAIARWVGPPRGGWRSAMKRPWFVAQVLLAGWVVVSLASALWSAAPAMSLAQGFAYALMLAWALGLAWTLDRAAIRYLLGGVIAISAAGAGLTIWYFFERAPTHRPGFPLGNPGVLAAMLLPALLLIASMLAFHARLSLQRQSAFAWRPVILLLLAAAPLVGAFWLADALAAKIGLLAGLTVLALLHLPRRSRWVVIVFGGTLALTLVGYRFMQAEEFALGRGASARFRLYSWSYATQLWQRAPFLGFGAAAYPRLANQLATTDRARDPAAIGDLLIGHAHNELFEVFAEIGLVGGVTFVGGHVATILTLLYLLRRQDAAWAAPWLAGLLTAYAALLVESLGNVSLRLPGVPVLFYLLLGAIWAWGRRADRPQGVAEEIETLALPDSRFAQRKRTLSRAAAVGLGALAVAVAVGGAANWQGVMSAYAAQQALRDDEPAQALEEASVANAMLLAPTRRIAAAEQVIAARVQLARDAGRRFITARQAGDATEKDLQTAVQALAAVYQAAMAFEDQVPAYGAMHARAADTAQALSRAFSLVNQSESRQWRLRAFRHWLAQRQQDPYHVQTLLALIEYPGTTFQHTLMLRDALRRSTVTQPAWRQAFGRVAVRPDFAESVKRLRQLAGPIVEETDVTNIIAAMAPEARRLIAADHARQGRFERAAEQAVESAALYIPLASRFPDRRSTALAEAAEYQFRADPQAPTEAIETMQAAITALPAIQPDERARQARPLRLRLLHYLVAGEQLAAAKALALGLTNQDVEAARVLLARVEASLIDQLNSSREENPGPAGVSQDPADEERS